jgi:hypothetical protein
LKTENRDEDGKGDTGGERAKENNPSHALGFAVNGMNLRGRRARQRTGVSF